MPYCIRCRKYLNREDAYYRNEGMIPFCLDCAEAIAEEALCNYLIAQKQTALMEVVEMETKPLKVDASIHYRFNDYCTKNGHTMKWVLNRILDEYLTENGY